MKLQPLHPFGNPALIDYINYGFREKPEMIENLEENEYSRIIKGMLNLYHLIKQLNIQRSLNNSFHKMTKINRL